MPSPSLLKIIFLHLKNVVKRLPLWLAIVSSIALLVELGFPVQARWARAIEFLLASNLLVSLALTLVRHFVSAPFRHKRVFIFDALSSVLLIGVLLTLFLSTPPAWMDFLKNALWRNLAVFIVLIREFGARRIDLQQTIFNPAQLFIFSFVLIILTGAMLLSLPNATRGGISFIDALFTSTSAVCVTGLTVVDTATQYTFLGQSIIMALIQIGGLGIMTFASYLTYFFRGGSSFENQLVLSQINQDARVGEVFRTLKNILLTTLSIEALGAAIIYFSIPESQYPGLSDRFFFAVFHSISGFCNAGFSTLTNNLYETPVRYAYALQLTIAILVILGGIGFPILFNLLTYGRTELFGQIRDRFTGTRHLRRPWQLNLQTRIVLITTGILLLFGTLVIYVLEDQHALMEHSGFGKWATAFFNATSPRTAGFNNVDMTNLQFPTVLIILFLMWVGASPGSTGGGIKTTTFAIGTLNFLSLARGKDRIELYRREISPLVIRRAFAVISLSLALIGLGILLLAVFDSTKSFYHIAFECFSAYGTVGLTLGITPLLSIPGKIVIILLMFIGRVGMLTLLIGFLPKHRHKAYNYPTDEVQTN